MPTRAELLAEEREHENPSSLRGKLQKCLQRFQGRKPEHSWLDAKLQEWLRKVSDLYGGREVLFYASAFTVRHHESRFSSIMWGDMEAMADAFHGADTSKGLVLIIHTPGGVVGAAKDVVEYLHKMFGDITAVVPHYAMSGGSMICLACDRIVMAKHGRLGPIDPQIFVQGRLCSTRSIVNTFDRANPEVMADSGKMILVDDAKRLLKHNEDLVPKWMQARMFKGEKDAKSKAEKVVSFFNVENKNPEIGEIYMHSQGVGMDILKDLQMNVEELESCQARQDAVLTVYRLAALRFGRSSATKLIANHRGNLWFKNLPDADENKT